MPQGVVLVVEDDEATAALLAEVLTAEGYWVTRVAAPGDALALLTVAGSDAFGLVLSRPFSQQGDPYAFLGQLRAATDAPIAICARTPAPVYVDYRRYGYAGLLAEPFDLADVKALVTSLAPPADEPVSA
jgi:DNA-binding response OmpR family regulator